MNKFIGMGRLTADPEIKHSGETIIASFTTAIDRKFKKEGDVSADFIRCIAFNKTAEFIEKYFKKGMKIAFVGHIQTGSYTNKDGHKVYTTDIVIDECEFCESKNVSQEVAKDNSGDGFVNVPSGIEEELPFN